MTDTITIEARTVGVENYQVVNYHWRLEVPKGSRVVDERIGSFKLSIPYDIKGGQTK